MFEQAFVECQISSKRPWTVVVSFAGQVLFVGVMVLVPLLHTGVIVPGRLVSILIAHAPAPPPPALASRAVAVQGPRSTRVFPTVLREPGHIPTQILIENGDPQPVVIADAGRPGVPGGFGSGGPSLLDAAPVAEPPTVAQAPAPAPPLIRLRIGGSVQAGKILRQVAPVYPAIARQARISGQVRLEAIIAKNGRIENLQVISGHPLLVQAALDAVRQWVYRPTLLNGDPVEVMTVIDVNFGLW